VAKRKKGDYEVGYGRPPKKTQFKKGKSGNPKGRPKRRLDVASTLERTLAEQIAIKDGEQMQEMSAGEAVLYKQVRKAMKGDQTAFDLVMRQAQRHGLLREEPRRDNSRGPKLVIGPPMSVEEWEEAARKQQAASKIASEKLYKEWLDE
jgi:hypothetical protein